MKKPVKFVVGALAVLGLGALVYARLNKPQEQIEAVPDPIVQVDTPKAGTIELSTELMGTIEPADVVYIIPKAAGEVLEVYAKMGDMVAKDQALFRIDNKQLDAAKITLDTAQVSLNDAQNSLNRMRVLYESGDISAQAYEQTVNGVSMARLQYQSAKLNYDIQKENSTVTAPIAGLLEQFDVEVHDMVGSGMVGVISGEGNKSVSFAVTEKVLGGLFLGAPVVIEKNGMEYTGTITELSTMVDAATGLFKVKASLDAAEALPTGTKAKLYVVSQRAENTMTVPVDCVFYSSGEAFVYTFDELEGVARKRPIEEGLIDAKKQEVLSGLGYEDQVIVSWTKELYDGAHVRRADETDEAGSASAAGQ